MEANIKVAISELHRLFYVLNKKFFDNCLPEPSILIQSNGKRKSVMGWCTRDQIWRDKENKVKKYELSVSAEFLNFPLEELVDTLLHEMTHLYCRIKDIQECSRSGSYHNKKFKEEAEKRGMEVTKSPKVGFGFTKLKPEVVEMVPSLGINQEAFKIARYSRIRVSEEEQEGEESEEGAEEEGDTHIRKYICPNETCPDKTMVRASKEVNVWCGACMVPMVYVPRKKKG